MRWESIVGRNRRQDAIVILAMASALCGIEDSLNAVSDRHIAASQFHDERIVDQVIAALVKLRA